MNIHFFDFDGTLSPRDSLISFLIFSVGRVRAYALLMLISPLILLHQMGLFSARQLKELLLRMCFKDRSRADLQKLGADFYQQSLSRHLYPDGQKVLEKLSKQGDKAVIVSASLDWWLEPFARDRGLELICTKGDFDNDKFTGRLATPNCKGKEKARRIKSAYELENYQQIYAYGDSEGDLEMFELADECYLKPFPIEGRKSLGRKLKACLKLMRIPQWIKNVFLFVPAFFAQNLWHTGVFPDLLLGFLLFSLLASAVYIMNDFFDMERDRLHPVKRMRPLASGLVSKRMAVLSWAVLMGTSLGGAFWFNVHFFGVCSFYFIINVAYTLNLKRYAIIDISIIALGFLLRVFAGGLVAGVPISRWLVLMTFLLSLIIAFSKRRTELAQQAGGKTRKSLAGYNLIFIDVSIVFLAAISVMSYIMYTMSEEVMLRFQSQYVYLTSFFVILGFLRFMQQSMIFNRTESPTKFLVKDRLTKFIILAWFASFYLIIYL